MCVCVRVRVEIRKGDAFSLLGMFKSTLVQTSWSPVAPGAPGATAQPLHEVLLSAQARSLHKWTWHVEERGKTMENLWSACAAIAGFGSQKRRNQMKSVCSPLAAVIIPLWPIFVSFFLSAKLQWLCHGLLFETAVLEPKNPAPNV